MLVTSLILGFLGLALGSFVNALVWRIHEQGLTKKKLKTQDLSILSGRSMCPNCRHELSRADLAPVFSWLWLRGKCRYCKKPISVQYPIVEIVLAAIFLLSYIFWPNELAGGGQWLLLATWLAVSVGLLALAVYDAKWMLLPNRIIYPSFFVALAGQLVYIVLYSSDVLRSLLLLIGSLLVASGIFFCLEAVSKGKWIGFGDVRLGLITGTVLAKPSFSLLMIFVASVIGTLAAVPDLVNGKKSAMSKLPFGPFLIIATAIVLLFGESVINWYTNLV
jgi:leader peptidase (prepilin peptidase) / N-methyltransferase